MNFLAMGTSISRTEPKAVQAIPVFIPIPITKIPTFEEGEISRRHHCHTVEGSNRSYAKCKNCHRQREMRRSWISSRWYPWRHPVRTRTTMVIKDTRRLVKWGQYPVHPSAQPPPFLCYQAQRITGHRPMICRIGRHMKNVPNGSQVRYRYCRIQMKYRAVKTKQMTVIQITILHSHVGE